MTPYFTHHLLKLPSEVDTIFGTLIDDGLIIDIVSDFRVSFFEADLNDGAVGVVIGGIVHKRHALHLMTTALDTKRMSQQSRTTMTLFAS